MSSKSIAREADDILVASEMIHLGARLQVLQAETSLSYDRLARLYREIRRRSPPKGMLPYSVDWFMTWTPNIHATLFYSFYRFLVTQTSSQGLRALIDAYRLYLEHCETMAPESPLSEPVLSFTRAWTLLRFFDSQMVQLSPCRQCGGQFLSHAYEPAADFVCPICKPPPRAGKRRAPAAGTARRGGAHTKG